MSAAIGWTNHLTNGYASPPGFAHNMTTAAVDSSKPLANYLTPDPSKVTRVDFSNSTGADSVCLLQKFVSGSNDKTFRLIAALNVRLPPSNWSQVYFGLFNAALSSGENVGTQTPSTVIVPIPGTTDRFNIFALLSVDKGPYAYIEFVFRTTTGMSGYFEIGHLWAGPALVWSGASAGVDRDWRLSYVDGSKVTRSNGGGFAAYRYPTRRVIEVQKSLLTYAQAHGDSASPSALSLRQFALEAGVSSPVVVIPRDTNAHTLQTLSVYGLVREPISIGHQGGDYYSTALSVEEIR